MSYEEIAVYLDSKARFIFPFLFLAFVVFYFVFLIDLFESEHNLGLMATDTTTVFIARGDIGSDL